MGHCAASAPSSPSGGEFSSSSGGVGGCVSVWIDQSSSLYESDSKFRLRSFAFWMRSSTVDLAVECQR